MQISCFCSALVQRAWLKCSLQPARSRASEFGCNKRRRKQQPLMVKSWLNYGFLLIFMNAFLRSYILSYMLYLYSVLYVLGNSFSFSYSSFANLITNVQLFLHNLISKASRHSCLWLTCAQLMSYMLMLKATSYSYLQKATCKSYWQKTLS